LCALDLAPRAVAQQGRHAVLESANPIPLGVNRHTIPVSLDERSSHPMSAAIHSGGTSSKRPAVWPSLLAPITGVIAAAVASGIAIVVVALLADPQLSEGDFQANLEHWVEANATSFHAIVATIVPGQVAFFGIALLFALLGRERWSSRLGFVRWRASPSTITLAVFGTLGVQFAIRLVAGQLMHEPSGSLKLLGRMFSEPRGMAALGVGILMSVGPGVCEETLFRGFTQRGLMKRWSPAVAIAVTSVLFSLAHFDLQHSLGVLPLGAWFGFVAWTTGSVWPTVLCHAFNNAASFALLRLGDNPGQAENPKGPLYYCVGTVLIAVAVLATLRLQRTRRDAVTAA